MRVTISSSSCDLIDEKYKESTRKVCSYLAQNNFDLNWGSGSTSLMGICYEVFLEYNRNIYGYTTPKYLPQLDDLSKASHQVYEDTFDLKKSLFNDADIIVVLPGGIGSISELFSYIEEIRSNDVDKKIIIYNEDNHFNVTLNLIDELIKKNFNNELIYSCFTVVNSFDEFKDKIDEVLN